MPTITTGREAQIRQLLEIRRSAAMDLAVMPASKQGSEWATDRERDLAYCNRQLTRLGHQD